MLRILRNVTLLKREQSDLAQNFKSFLKNYSQEKINVKFVFEIQLDL